MKISDEKLNLALANSCLSMTELAELSGINKVTLTRISKRKQEPMPRTVGRLAKALNVGVTELIED